MNCGTNIVLFEYLTYLKPSGNQICRGNDIFKISQSNVGSLRFQEKIIINI